MAVKPSLFKKIFLVLGMLFFCVPGFAQDYKKITDHIDSLVNIGLPRSALSEVNVLDKLARQNKNAAMQIKAAIYRMTFQSYIEENSIVPIIDTLKSDIAKASFPVKPVLQSVLAAMYYGYYQQNRWQLSQRTRLENPGADFTKWDLQTIISEAGRQYMLSLQNEKLLQNTPVSILDGVLKGDEVNRYLRPSLYDLLLHRALDFFLADEPALTKPKQPFSLNDPLLFSDSRTFAGLKVTTTDTASTWYKGTRYLQQATLFHLQKGDVEALADLDMTRLGFLHDKASFAGKDSLYLQSVQKVANTFSDKPISADALELLGKYYQQKDSLTMAMSFYQKATSSFPTSIGGLNAAIAIKQLHQKLLSSTVEEIYSPGKPLLARVSYRNVKKAKVFIYKLTAEQEAQVEEYVVNRYHNNRSKTISDLFAKLNAVEQKDLSLPGTEDYRLHNSEFKIDPLKNGNYALLINDGSNDTTLTQFASFKVSRISYVSRMDPDGHILLNVMDRESGEPLRGVQVYISGYNNQLNADTEPERGATGTDGSFVTKTFMDARFSLELRTNGDTLTAPQQYAFGPANRARYKLDKDRTTIFTDRQIYRPGQTIYFKLLEITSDGDKNAIKPYADGSVDLRDINGKTINSISFKTNAFGTFAGSFTIPQNMLNGNIALWTTDGGINVRVEEYKRPTFQVEFLPVKETYKLNDSVTVKGTVTAFSGYGISQAKVACHVTQSSFVVNYMNRGFQYSSPNTTEITEDTVIADMQGNFTIKFKAARGDGLEHNYNSYAYALSADVTDGNGETHSAKTQVVIGNPAILINAYIPDRIINADSVSLPVRINNLNMQPQAGTIHVEVYSLKSLTFFPKKRLWSKPDKYLLSPEDYKTDFPEYTYIEEKYNNWSVLNKIEEFSVATSVDKPAIMRFKLLPKQPSGEYKIKVIGTDASGHTTSITKYLSLVTNPSIPQNSDDWVIPITTKVKPGQNARFLVGAGNSNILMEKINNDKIAISKWLHIDSIQQYIDVPVLRSDSNIHIQFLMVHQGRVYNISTPITIDRPEQSLNIEMITFRDKLQPGEKDEWKLRIKGGNNEKENAELLASLYDASLDDLSASQSWEGKLPIRFSPNYFIWNPYDFITSKTTYPLKSIYAYYNFTQRNYEELDLSDYNYYGAYNANYQNYVAKLRQRMSIAEHDAELEKTYNKVSAEVKNGFEVTGYVTEEKGGPLPGVVAKIKGTGLAVVTNSKGYFRIKVPANNSLIISFTGYDSYETKITKNSSLTIPLKVDNSALHEVVVVGYAAQKQVSVTGAIGAIDIRGNSYHMGQEVTKARLSGADYIGADGAQAIQNLPADIIENIQVVNDYGDQATRTGIKDGDPTKVLNITTRKNFAETAFFYPQLHTDKNGEVLIDFTIPETLTKWRFKGFAHTKDLKTGYIEREIVTQKQLSINANMPRFLREGDTLTVSARLVNLTASALKGKVELQLFNSLNMQPVSLLLNKADAVQNFDIQGANTKAISFKITVPAGLQALTYRLTAESGKFTDGEENTLAVLPNRMLVTESMPIMVRPGQQREFTFDKLLNETSKTLQNKTLTLEYTQNPAWYAILALPYMMEFPYECSEQIFSRYYANSMATNLVNRTPAIKRVFDQWKNSNSPELLSNLEKNPELKSTLIEETPWLRDAENETEQKKRIALLFDLNKMSYELQQNLDKLQKKQLPGGGFPWFGGERADRYITQHILAGIGQLYYSGVTSLQDQGLKGIADKATDYLDNELIDDANREKTQKTYEERILTPIEIHAWYIQSYFTTRTMSAEMQALQANYLKLAVVEWNSKNVYEQAMIALTMLRNKKTDIAQMIIRSIKETAQQSDDMGMYWAKNQLGYYWYQSPIETQSLMIELFTEAGNNEKAVEEMKIWLLRNKQTNNWKTTKATAAACYALLMKGDDLLSDKGKSEIKLDGKALVEFNPDVKADAGTGYIKTTWTDEQIKPALGKVNIKNGGKTIGWGALHWQYLENLDKITASKTDIELERKYFIQKQTANGQVLTAIDAAHQPKTGDLLKVVVYLKAGRDFEYIHLKDMRPAGTEPVDVLSAYKYQDGLYYYQVTQDVATNFFISSLNKGNYVFEYSLRVEQPGNFSTGISTIESMYAPEYNAHSEGKRLVVKSQ